MNHDKPRRFARQAALNLSAPPERIFPLLCPVREYDWLLHWQCEMIYSESGVAENNGIFRTRFPGENEATWVVSRYEPENFVIQFVRFEPPDAVVRLDIQLFPAENGGARAEWNHTLTALTEAGRDYIALFTPEAHEAEIRFLEASLNHYCRTGEMLATGYPGR